MYSQFTNKYSLSKTLRFELRPVAETADHIKDFKSAYLQEVVEQDQKRAEDYKRVKQIIDDYHRTYIEDKLGSPVNPETGEIWITPEDFKNAYECYQQIGATHRKLRAVPRDKKHEKQRKERQKELAEKRKQWAGKQSELRKKLVKYFNDKDKLFEKDFIKKELPERLEKQGKWKGEKKTSVEAFKTFTTYFTGFQKNRKNMYTDKDQRTAIAYRLMNENLRRFFDNCVNYRKITEKYPDLKFKAECQVLKNLGVKNVKQVFQPGFFINLLTQSGIDAFQELLGGRTEKSGTGHQGLNQAINQYRQDLNRNRRKQNKPPIKRSELPNLKKLYKQILSERETRSFIPEGFADDKQLREALKSFIKEANGSDGLIDELNTAVQKLEEADPDLTYVKQVGLRDISRDLFGDYAVIDNALNEYVKNTEHPTPKSGKITQALEKDREKYLRREVFSLAELDRALTDYIKMLDDEAVRKKLQAVSNPERPILSCLIDSIEAAKKPDSGRGRPGLAEAIKQVKPLLKPDKSSKGKRAPDPDHEKDKGKVQKIKQMLDAFMAVSYAVKPLHLVKGGKDMDTPGIGIDMGFYAEFREAYERYSGSIIGLYNKTRNYLTKKPFSEAKIKINFEAPTFLNGWDLNKAWDDNCILLRRKNNYYLAIGKQKAIGNTECLKEKEYNKIFFPDSPPEISGDCYEKINYKQFKAVTQLPRLFIKSKKGRETFNPSEEIRTLYKNKEHKNGDTFKLESCHKLINFFKANMQNYKVNPDDEFGWDVFAFKFSSTESYKDIKDIDEFYKEVDDQSYKLWFSNVAKSDIDDCIKQGKLFLFQIYNKDFSTYSTGKSNLHTLYWKGLFESENLNDVVLKLNGKAEMFYREHSIKFNDIVTHLKKKAINNKNQANKKKASIFKYDIVKDRRYTQDKFMLHVPITLNFKQPKNPSAFNFNNKVNLAVKNNPDTHIIGIDRGERHLLYYTVINSKGRIVEQGSLNEVSTDRGYKVDYQQKLHTREKERDMARKSWSSIGNIKEFKTGYLSHIVHRLAGLIIKHNAIVCLEDLNFGFKRGRFKVEKQVYQKFEKALIDKLNYLVFKDAEPGKAGHYLKAYQLTAPFISFDKLGKQSGILYYVPAAYTSKICPATGFMNFLYTRYKSCDESKAFFGKMKSIRYNSTEKYFEFKFDYADYSINKSLGSYRTDWTVCTHGTVRYRNIKKENKWVSELVDVTEGLKTLFGKEKIKYEDGRELKDDIVKVGKKDFYTELYRLLESTLRLRHSKIGAKDDFILSPVKDENGVFFDSRNATDKQPKDADANGAYHIALKGSWVLKERIKDWDGEGKLNLAMSNEDWFGFVNDFIKKQN